MRWVDRADAIPPHLWRAFFPPPLEGLWYYRAFSSATIAAGMTFSYGLVCDEENVLAIVPTFVFDVPLALGAPPRVARVLRVLEAVLPALVRTRTLFVGSPTSVHGTIGLRDGVELADVMPAITASLERRAAATRAALIVWKDFPTHAAPAFLPQLADGSLVALDDFPGTSLALPPTWEAYMASLNGRRRCRLRKKLRQSHEAVDLETAVVQRPDRATIAEIHALYHQTHARASTKFEELTIEFFHQIARAEAAHFVLLRERETRRLVAFMLCFVVGDRAVNRFVGLDYAFVRPWNLHFRLWEAALRFMISAGATEVHSGPTSYRFKVDTGHALIPMTTYVKHRNPLLHRFMTPMMRESMRRTRWAER